MSLPWVIRYHPTTISEFVGTSEAIKQLEGWLLSWEGNRPTRKAAFLYGPPGVGKTSSVYIVAEKFCYDTIEMNAGDWRTGKSINRVVGSALSQSTLFGLSKRLVILDELEGISGTADREGISTLIRIVKKAFSPVVFIADDAWSPRFRELRSLCKLIEFKRIPLPYIKAHLKKICESESVVVEDKALQLIAKRSGGDLRSAIIDLQALAQGKKQLSYRDVDWLGIRDRKEVIFNTLKLIFNTGDCISARQALNSADVHYEMLFEWIYENAPYQLTDKQDLCDIMDALAKASLYFHRIRVSQNWGLLPYALDLMSAGVATSRKKTRPKWIPFKFPQRIKMMSKTRGDRQRKLQIGLKVGEKCHVSAKTAVVEYLPYLKIIFSSSDDLISSRIAEELGLDAGAVKYLKGNAK